MPSAERPFLAIALRIIAMILIAIMLTLVKYAGDEGISMPEVMFWRQFVTLPILIVWLYFTGSLARLKTSRLASHGARGAIGTFGMLCHFTGVTLLPLAEATTLGFSTPLFVVLISAVILREHVGPWRWLAVFLGFLGVLMIAQPGGHPIPPLGAAAALASGLVVAIINFQIRDLAKTDSAESIVFYFGLFGTLIAATLMPFYATSNSMLEWAILVGIGVSGTVGQLLITLSLRHAPVSTVIVIDYTLLIWTMTFGWFFWASIPPTTTWLGAPVIIAAGLIIAWRQHRLSQAITEPALTGTGQQGT